jgi:hypothetical protein
VRQQRLADPLHPAFLATHVIGQPLGQLLGVGHAALAEGQELADRLAVPLHGPPRPLEEAQIGGGDLHLGGDVGDRLVV